MNDESIIIHLTKNEALVFFDFLARINSKNDDKFIEDQAEQRVLWDIESTLETQLAELFQSNYDEILCNNWQRRQQVLEFKHCSVA